jgi:hypothetical protein
MTAAWVLDDLDLVKWVEQSVSKAGAYWLNVPRWQIGPLDVPGLGEVPAVQLRNNDLVIFYQDDSRLKIEFAAYSAPAGWVYPTYSYHYETVNRKMIFRFDNHDDPDFENEHGTTCHVHIGKDHKRHRKPTRDVDLDDVLACVHEWQTTGTFTYV